METLQAWLALPLVKAAIVGLVGAAVVDVAAFRSWKSFNDAVAYDWNVAAWRWFQGTVSGLLAGLGLEQVS